MTQFILLLLPAKREKADVITTEKDLVKLERTRWGKPQDLGFHVFVVSVSHEFSESDESKWNNALNNVKAHPTSN